jgi:PAS domain-containing protein
MIPAGDDNKTNWKITLYLGFFTLIASLSGNLFLYKSSGDSVESENIRAFMENQIKVNEQQGRDIVLLKQEVEEWRSLYIKISTEKLAIELEIQRLLNEKPPGEVELAVKWVEDMPFPAVLKKRNDDGIFAIVTVNNVFTRRYGLTKEEAEGKTDDELFPPEFAAQYKLDDETVALTGRSLTSTAPYLSKSGEIIDMKHTKYKTVFSNGKAGIIVVILD